MKKVFFGFSIFLVGDSSLVNNPVGVRLEGIIVLVFIILEWIFVLMNTTTMIPCRQVS